MKIIAITGLMGSGKDTVEKYIEEKYGYKAINYSNILREIAKKEGIEINRKNLQMLRKKRGNNFLAEEVVKIAKQIISKGVDKIILTTLRRSEDYEIPKKEFSQDLRMILVTADRRIRFERMKARHREDDPENMEEFEEQEERDNKLFDFDKTFSYADFEVANNGTREELFKQLDKIIKNI